VEKLKFINKIEEVMLYIDEIKHLLYDGKLINAHGKIIGIIQKLDFIIKNIQNLELVTKIEEILLGVKELNNIMIMGKIIQAYEKTSDILIRLNGLRNEDNTD